VSTENTPHEHERRSFKPRADDKQPAAAIRWSRGAGVLLESDNQSLKIDCNRILRVLPGKRLVCTGKFTGQDVVVKFFMDSRRAARHSLREEKGIRALQAAGIKTPALLDKGALKPDLIPVLVFQKIDAEMDFVARWQLLRDDVRRSELLSRVVAVIADQHSAGLKQDDLHLGNFVLAGNEIYSVDGGSIDSRFMGSQLSEEESLKNLGLFFAQFYPGYDRLIYKVFGGYVEKRGWSLLEDLYARLIKSVHSQRAKRKRKYLKKIYRECSSYVCRISWNRFLVYSRELQKEDIHLLLKDPDTFMAKGRLLKDGNTTTLALVNVGGLRLVVKRYNIKNAGHALKRCLRPSRAWKSWKNAHRLALLGIPTPRPIALVEKRWGPLRSKAYFITEYIEANNLSHLLRPGKVEEINLKDLVEQFVEMLQLFADASLSHGDFKATNFLVDQGQISITDLDAVREHRFRWLYRRAFRKDCKRLMKNWEGLVEIEKTFQERLQNLAL
jgi:tRNA A-37 threonylcarbamoyl transferase component Bud32